MGGSPDPAALAASLIARLEALRNPANVAGMARYGINPEGTLGVPVAVLREIAKEQRPLRRDEPAAAHSVAARLWDSGVHEARILAGLIEVPALVTRGQADAWASDLDSWDVCDQLCSLFAATGFAYELVADWTVAEELFVKRAGFVVACALAVHDKKADDRAILDFLVPVEREATDGRPYVKKAVNWTLRQVGKRSPACHTAALASAERILAAHPDSAAARWIARDALRELRSDPVLRRVAQRRASA
ncbi:MAG: DNA alkylation repair protein [Propionicimonas sp.]|uniref:DNA alkylation repair protein n=1 Tax=Propionicimonas sp. TaxID=1955623 RepID=UPI003D0D9AD7